MVIAVVFLLTNLLNTVISTKINSAIKTQDVFQFANIAKTSEGHVLRKNDSLFSRTTTSSEEECWFKCAEEPPCLSFNVILLGNNTYSCEIFNWAGSNASGMLVPKQNAYHGSIKGICYNGGTCLRQTTFGCECACLNAFKGQFCETIKDGPFKDCAAWQSAGVVTSGVYKIDPDSKGSFHAYCDMTSEGGGWTVISNRMDGTVNFNQAWAQYKAGFGDLTKEFWLGNDYIHRLTAARPATQLYIPMETSAGVKSFAKYSTFSVADESNKYRLTATGHSGTAPDSFNHATGDWRANGMPFCTPDRDNDRAPSNCAAERKAGWWFNYCGASYLTAYPMIWNVNTQMSKGAMKIKSSS